MQVLYNKEKAEKFMLRHVYENWATSYLIDLSKPMEVFNAFESKYSGKRYYVSPCSGNNWGRTGGRTRSNPYTDVRADIFDVVPEKELKVEDWL